VVKVAGGLGILVPWTFLIQISYLRSFCQFFVDVGSVDAASVSF
jgi:hypothetical protein